MALINPGSVFGKALSAPKKTSTKPTSATSARLINPGSLVGRAFGGGGGTTSTGGGNVGANILGGLVRPDSVLGRAFGGGRGTPTPAAPETPVAAPGGDAPYNWNQADPNPGSTVTAGPSGYSGGRIYNQGSDFGSFFKNSVFGNVGDVNTYAAQHKLTDVFGRGVPYVGQHDRILYKMDKDGNVTFLGPGQEVKAGFNHEAGVKWFETMVGEGIARDANGNPMPDSAKQTFWDKWAEFTSNPGTHGVDNPALKELEGVLSGYGLSTEGLLSETFTPDWNAMAGEGYTGGSIQVGESAANAFNKIGDVRLTQSLLEQGVLTDDGTWATAYPSLLDAEDQEGDLKEGAEEINKFGLDEGLSDMLSSWYNSATQPDYSSLLLAALSGGKDETEQDLAMLRPLNEQPTMTSIPFW